MDQRPGSSADDQVADARVQGVRKEQLFMNQPVDPRLFGPRTGDPRLGQPTDPRRTEIPGGRRQPAGT